MQGTSVNKSRSDRNPIRAGVPQGSLLGPRLFASYVNDLPDSITSGEVYMYADDTTIYVVGNTVDDITTALQAVLDQVNSWCLSNRLILHEGKSEAMVLSTTPFIGPLKRFCAARTDRLNRELLIQNCWAGHRLSRRTHLAPDFGCGCISFRKFHQKAALTQSNNSSDYNQTNNDCSFVYFMLRPLHMLDTCFFCP